MRPSRSCVGHGSAPALGRGDRSIRSGLPRPIWPVPTEPAAPATADSAKFAGSCDRPAVVGLAVLTAANLVMVGVMTMAPLQLQHIHSGLTAVGLVASLHIAAMFAPARSAGG